MSKSIKVYNSGNCPRKRKKTANEIKQQLIRKRRINNIIHRRRNKNDLGIIITPPETGEPRPKD